MEARTRLGLGGQAELLTRAVGFGGLKAAANKRSNLDCEINLCMSLFNKVENIKKRDLEIKKLKKGF